MIYSEHKNNNKILRISYDEDAQNPRQAFDNLSVFVLNNHKKYDFPNEINASPYDFDTIIDFERYLKNKYDAFIVKPVYIYEHSGIKLTFNRFSRHSSRYYDFGLAGFVYVTKDAIRENFGIKRITENIINKTHNILYQELEIYNEYLNGNVFKYDLIELQKANCCNHKIEVLINSIGGFYGTDFKENGLIDYLENPEEWRSLLGIE